jgi:UDP-3-O-acyl N-acetylglucosamine deacetylase
VTTTLEADGGRVGARSQRTLARPAAFAGVGYWTGRPVTVRLLPAPAGVGVVFVRTDLRPAVRLPAMLASRVEASGRTNLAAGGVRVEMVEHVLSALAALGVDCCEVRLDGPELPGLDGSSLRIVEAIESAGREDLAAPSRPLRACGRIRVEDAGGWIEAHPPRFDGLSVDYSLDYGDGPIGRQSLEIDVTPDSYRRDLAAARTFIEQEAAEKLRASGRGLAVSEEDLLVFGPEGPLGNSLRWPDECVRHKVLDVVGDLSLAGRPVQAFVRCHKSGHRLNAMLLSRLVALDRSRPPRRCG